MNWKPLTESSQLDEIIESSNDRPVIIFKHSTRCSISAVSLNRLERSWNEAETKDIEFFVLDLIRFRDLSNRIAETFDILHQSPQMLVIRDGKCIHEASHFGIDYQDLRKFSGLAA